MTKEQLEFTADRVFAYKEMLMYYINVFKDKQLAGWIDYRHYSRVKISQPDYAQVNNQTGKIMNIDQLILGSLKLFKHASQTVKYLTEMLEKIKDNDDYIEEEFKTMLNVPEPSFMAKTDNKIKT